MVPVTPSDRPAPLDAPSASALSLQLAAARDNGRLEALVLADARGMVIASAGEMSVCEALGALAPLAPRAWAGSCMADLVGGADVSVRALSSNGYPLYLAAIGGTAARDALLARAASHVQRILVTN